MTYGIIAAPNLLNICIDRCTQGDYSGRLWNLYRKEPITYTNSIDLIRKMENFFNDIDFPQNSTVSRSFKKNEVIRKKKEGVVAQMDAKDIMAKKGDIGTFIVHVKYRQNATWQGEVIWADKKEKKYFRSVLELLKLIDSALDEQ